MTASLSCSKQKFPVMQKPNPHILFGFQDISFPIIYIGVTLFPKDFYEDYFDTQTRPVIEMFSILLVCTFLNFSQSPSNCFLPFILC